LAHKRTEFTDNQKAEIYVRDNATCAFSCISLWVLDIGIRPNWEDDWVDHIKPSASGGSADLINGICASETFNKKKRDNTSDNIYFVKEGKITKDYINVFGLPPESLIEQLKRLSNLHISDWFFNKAITCIYTAFDWRCDIEFNNKKLKRDDTYWYKAAWKKLQIFQKKKPIHSINARNLVMQDMPFGTQYLLELETLDNYDNFIIWCEKIYPTYRDNYQLFHKYFKINDSIYRKNILYNSKKLCTINPEFRESLTIHNTII